MRTGRIVAAAVVAGVIVVLGLTLPYAGAQWNGDAAEEPAARLLLTAEGPSGERERGVALECDPVGGDHPDAAAACRELAEVDGDVAALDEVDKACTMEFNPVTVSVEGNWGQTEVSFQEEFGNACVLEARTGPIFQF